MSDGLRDGAEPMAQWVGLCIDAADAEQTASFYASLLGWQITASDGDRWFQLRDPSGGAGINIQGDDQYVPPVWPEAPGEQQKMMHFEIEVDDVETGVRRAINAGGTEAPHQPPDRDADRIRVVLDPAGHPMCLFLRGE